ncbi:MAG: hypothetical protein ACR2IE_19160 [Candidatus Sumerlaeaceae bacterium]
MASRLAELTRSSASMRNTLLHSVILQSMTMTSVFIYFLPAVFALCPLTLPAQIIATQEAEGCTIAPAKFYHLENSRFASADKYIAQFGGWTRQSMAWSFKLQQPVTEGRLAIRYSCDQSKIQERRGQKPAPRQLLLTVDRTLTGTVPVPDTGGWDTWHTAYMQLTSLSAGEHTFTLTAPAPLTTTHLDCFTLFVGDPAQVLPGPLRSNIVAKQKYPPITIKMTPGAHCGWTPEQLLAHFTKIYHWFHNHMGWEPDRPIINVNIYDTMHEVAHENGAGVHFQAADAQWNVGNWVHEMNHVFDNHYFPGWITHPLIRTNDAFDSCDAIFPDMPKQMREYQQKIRPERTALGLKLLENPTYRTDDPHEVLYAVRVKYGPDILRKFYHALKAAHDRGEIRLQRQMPHRGIFPLSKLTIVKYMSEAAGEDVGPLFYRWNGWVNER